MKVAVLQMVSSHDVTHNLETAESLIAQASANDAELIVLPEYFCGMGFKATDKLQWAEPLGRGPIQASIAAYARKHGVWIVAGTIPTQTQTPAKVHNTSMLFSPQGECTAHYDKIHLFNFQGHNETYNEDAVIAPGHEPVVAHMVDRTGHRWRLGLSVCYDIRFPELYRIYAAQGVDILLAPAAFTYTTGQAHWEVLLRARAIENQCWLLAAAQGGNHTNGRQTWGHSMVVDPWGQILAQQTMPGIGITYAFLDIAYLQQVRQSLPALENRCL